MVFVVDYLSFSYTSFFYFFIFFIINSYNLIITLIYSELLWILVYIFTLNISIYVNDMNSLSNSFFILVLASVEFSIGFMFLILLKKFNFSFNLDNKNKMWSQFLLISMKLNILKFN